MGVRVGALTKAVDGAALATPSVEPFPKGILVDYIRMWITPTTLPSGVARDLGNGGYVTGHDLSVLLLHYGTNYGLWSGRI